MNRRNIKVTVHPLGCLAFTLASCLLLWLLLLAPLLLLTRAGR